MRFLHCADIHLAKPFGRFDEDTRVTLRNARLDALRAIGQAAVTHQAGFVLIAGDTFDAEAPPTRTIRRAMSIMAEFPDVIWVLMPGNHDSLAAVDLWQRIAKEAPDNLRLATQQGILEIGPDVAILACPPTVRNPGNDLTAWTGNAETGGRFRIGLAHGGVVEFGSEDGVAAIIPPDRAEQSQLDYLALGDWHGQMRLSARCWYAGTPEADSFKPHPPAGVLLIEIAATGDMPIVTPLPIGQFVWQTVQLNCLAGEDPVEQLTEALPASNRDKTLIRLVPSGRLGLLDHSRLRRECDRIGDDFLFFEVQWDRLGIAQVVEDLNLIAEGGALRSAADKLLAATDLQGRTAEEAKIAEIALTHLFHIAQEEAI